MTDREAVALAICCHGDKCMQKEMNDALQCSGECTALKLYATKADAAIAALTALGWQRVGPDQVVMPKEPSDTMNDAARDWSVKLYGKAIGKDASKGCYRAMIEARPK